MAINKTIFRSYDIRGSSLLDITPTIAYKIGFCFTKMNISKHWISKCRQYNKINFIEKQKSIIIGRDGRLSSPHLYNALVNGIITAGGQVVSVGIVPSPALYFADKVFKPQASIMITGSHNHKDDNGFKMLSQGKSFFNQQIQLLLNNILNTDWSNIPNQCIALTNVRKLDITNKYINRILQEITIDPKIKVAWDPANGVAGNITKLLTLRLPNKNIVINSKIDGNFPNHHPDPTIPKNLEQLIKVVERQDCDIGIAFDGDADRIGIISKKGRIILGDQILCILAKDIISQNPNATIIMDSKSSNAIFDQIKSYGGRPIMWKTGHSFIKDKMQTTKALLGGETSGHIFFADKYYGYDDAIYAALRLLHLLSRSSKNLDDMIDELPKCRSSVEIKISVADDLKFTIIQKIKEELVTRGITFNGIDGIRINSCNAWWLLRASNTEAKIIAKCESDNLQELNNIKLDVLSLLAKYGLKLE